MRHAHILVVVLMLLSYGLPWVSVPAVAGFTNNAYDLAEWMSIHPAVRSESFLLTPLLLRVPLVCIAVYLATGDTNSKTSRLRLTGVILLGAALLPPWEFFSSASGDANYQQSCALAIAAIVLGGLGFFQVNRQNPTLALVLRLLPLLIAITAGVVGLTRALPILQSMGLDATIGIGCAVFGLACLLAILEILSKCAVHIAKHNTG